MERPDSPFSGIRERRGLRLVLNSQTPLIRFTDEFVAEAGDGPIVSLDGLRVPEDYKFNTGGVTRMVFPLLKRWLGDGTLASAEWVAMAVGPRAPRVLHDDVALRFVGLPTDKRAGYAQVKERMWALLNTNPGEISTDMEEIPDEAWEAFDAYQRASARALEQAADGMGGADLLYVHDFQQLGVARAWRGPSVPKIFHLHTPFPRGMPDEWVDYMLARLNDYDAVVVSTNRYAENLRAAGLRTPIRVVHPFIDPDTYREATDEDVARLRAKFDIAPSDHLILNVARMDPMKGQDRLIRAMPAILREEPNARLVLVGNGSFSSSRKGGLGLNKGQQWRAHLEALAKDLDVSDRITFTGHLDDELLPAAYRACDVFCLPSTREGFGLAVVEAWRQAKPVVVSERAGIAELVVEGENGRVTDCADPERLARALLDVIARPEQARAMGEAGLSTSELATLTAGRRSLESLFATLVGQEAPHASA